MKASHDGDREGDEVDDMPHARGRSRFGQVVKTEMTIPYMASTPSVNAVVEVVDAFGTKICARPTPMSDPNTVTTWNPVKIDRVPTETTVEIQPPSGSKTLASCLSTRKHETVEDRGHEEHQSDDPRRSAQEPQRLVHRNHPAGSSTTRWLKLPKNLAARQRRAPVRGGSPVVNAAEWPNRCADQGVRTTRNSRPPAPRARADVRTTGHQAVAPWNDEAASC